MKKIILVFVFFVLANCLIAQVLDDSGLSGKKYLYCSDNTLGLIPLNGLSIYSSHGLMPNRNLSDMYDGFNAMFSLGVATNFKVDRYGAHFAVCLEPRIMTRYLSLFFPQGYSPTGFVSRHGYEDGKGYWGALGLGLNIPFTSNWHITVDNLWQGTTLGYELRVGLTWRIMGRDFP